MGSPLKIAGVRFGMLVAIKPMETNKHRKIPWECVCDCGARISVVGSSLKNGTTKSCGCSKSERISKAKFLHGRGTSDPTYMSWSAMRDRCKRRPSYIRKGITVCKRWDTFLLFLEDMGERPAGKTLDRIDNAGSYSPDNCRWATVQEQNRNSDGNRPLTFNGETLLITDWEKRLGLNNAVITKRLKRGWSVERALRPIKSK